MARTHTDVAQAYGSLMRASRLNESDRANVNTLMQRIKTLEIVVGVDNAQSS